MKQENSFIILLTGGVMRPRLDCGRRMTQLCKSSATRRKVTELNPGMYSQQFIFFATYKWAQ
jgi:hypothetical protein